MDRLDRYNTQMSDETIEENLSTYIYRHKRHSKVICQYDLTFDLFDVGAYRIIIHQSKCGKIHFATCNCTGFYFHQKCKHVQFVKIKGDVAPHDIPKQHNKTTTQGTK